MCFVILTDIYISFIYFFTPSTFINIQNFKKIEDTIVWIFLCGYLWMNGTILRHIFLSNQYRIKLLYIFNSTSDVKIEKLVQFSNCNAVLNAFTTHICIDLNDISSLAKKGNISLERQRSSTEFKVLSRNEKTLLKCKRRGSFYLIVWLDQYYGFSVQRLYLEGIGFYTSVDSVSVGYWYRDRVMR